MILRTLQKHFSQRCRKIFARGPKVFGSFLKKNSTHTIFSTKYFPFKFSCGTVHFFFGNPAGGLLTKLKKIRSKNENYEKYTIFSKKNFTEMILGTCRRLFLQPESFCSMSKNDKMFLLPTNSPLKISIETWNAVFSHLHKKFCWKAKIFSCQVPKKYRKPKSSFLNFFFRQNVPMDT